jgi:lysophospholipase L1-like esterase
MSAYLAEIVAPCAYVDSQKMSRPGEWTTIDGQHFTAAGYRAWGRSIAAAVTSPAFLKTLKR